MTDLVVIGSGASGFAAAVAAKEQGLSVTVVTRGVGASAICSGAFDFGPLPTGSDLSFAAQSQTPAWKAAYSKLLVEDAGPSAVDTDRFFTGAARALSDRMELNIAWDRPRALPLSNGNWKPVYAAQATQSEISLEEFAGKRIGLAFHPSWRFPGAALCRQWQDNAERVFGQKIELGPCELSLSPMMDAPIPNVAVRLQRDGNFRESFEKALREKAADWDALLIPPLFLDPLHFRAARESVVRPLSECLATLEAVPGKRLQHAMEQSLRAHGIPLLSAQKCSARIEGRTIRSLETWSAGDTGKQQTEADRFILATGKYLGGGVEMGYELAEEPLFNLPLFWSRDDGQVERRAQLPWADRHFLEAQPWSQVGVWVDGSSRPVGPDKQPVYDNLFACGSVLGGVDFAREQIGLGFMMVSGGRSGLTASKA